jgi:hypothetical protein
VGAGSASFGAPVVGPAGLVTLLEAELGLGDPPSSVLDRVVAWRAKREAADGSERFWTRSLAADAWATARLLLGWRDDLVAAGWRPDVGCSEHRLDDLPAPSRRLIRQLADAGAEVPERPPEPAAARTTPGRNLASGSWRGRTTVREAMQLLYQRRVLYRCCAHVLR